MLIQNGYKVNHYILIENNKDQNQEFKNDYYSNIYLDEKDNKIRETIEKNDVIVFNNHDLFVKIFNGYSENMNYSIIINCNFEVYIKKFNKTFKLFEEKQMISMIGLLANLRPYNQIVTPFFPKINIFVNLA